MATGWNLISIPFQLSDSKPDVVLQTIHEHCDYLWTYDSQSRRWKGYTTGGVDFLNTIDAIEPGRGYWFHILDAAVLDFGSGELARGSISLKAGWNLVGFNSLKAKPVAEAISSIASCCKSVWTYEPEGIWRCYVAGGPSSGDDLEFMEPRKGYWLEVIADCIWLCDE